MTFAAGYSIDEARMLLTLAADAYVDETALPGETVQAQTTRMRCDINAALGQSPQYKDWQIVWGPGLAADRGNMMYIAGNRATGQYAVAVRGTDWSFWLDWVEDFGSLLPLIGFPYVVPPATGDIRIAAGTSFGLSELIQMRGSENTPDADADTAEAFLRALPAGSEVYVTGHSLGGCLASVVAAWLASVYGGSARLKAYTFAAPSAGNQGFADYYNRLFTDPKTDQSTAYRVFNSLDSVPNAWATLSTIPTYYAPSPLCPSYIKDIVDEGIKDVGTEYVQVGDLAAGSAVELTGTVVPWSSWWDLDPTGTAQFAHQVGEQHATATYLGLLAAPPHLGATVKLRAMGARTAARKAARSGS
jgi:hypothetical protein